MPKYRIDITQAAEQDLAELVEYIALDNPSAALKFMDEIEEKILPLEDFPLMGVTPQNRRLARKGYKILIMNDYLIFYIVHGETVEIRRILSGKRYYAALL